MDIIDKKVKVIFVYQVSSFWTSWESLYYSCMQDERFEVKILWIDGTYGDKAQMQDSEVFLKKNNIPYEPFSYENVMGFAPDYMLYQTPYDKGHRIIDTWTIRYKMMGIKIVYIPYGIEISDTAESRYKHFSLSVVVNADAIYVLSDDIKKQYERSCMNSNAVKVFGLPRFDALLKKYSLPQEVKEQKKGRKLILWKSHFPKIFIENGIKKQATPDLNEYMKFVEYIRKEKDLFFVFMPHPKFIDATIDNELRPNAQKIITELQELENVYIDMNDDYRMSLTNADAIIVDRSAVMVEAGVKGVPVLYMYNKDYTEPMVEPIQDLLDGYYQGTTASEMIDFCEMQKKNQDPRKQERIKAFQKCVPYLDGRCAARIKEDLYLNKDKKMKENDIDLVKKINKKVAIFGTGGICKYIMNYYDNRENKELEISYYVENDLSKQGKEIYGKKIIGPDQLNQMNLDYIVIATDRYYFEVYKQLTEKNQIDKKKIMYFDQFAVLCKFT